MKKNFKTLLCAAAILGSMSASVVFADNEISSNIDSPTVITGETSVINDIEVTSSGSLTINSTAGVTEADGDLNIEAPSSIAQPTLTNNGTITIDNALNISGTVDNNANINTKFVDNMGTINNNAGASLEATIIDSDGTINNSGNTFNVNNFINSGNFNNSANATISSLNNGENDNGTITSGTIVNDAIIEATNVENIAGSSIQNNNGATITATNNFINSGIIENNNGSEIKVDNILTNEGTITNNGTITAESVQNVANKTINGSGTLEFEQGHNDGNISQTIINQLGGSTFENNGEITADKFNIDEDGIFRNYDANAKLTMNGGTNNGSISGGIIDIKGDYTNNGVITINNNSDFTIKEGLTISGNGTFGIQGTNNGTINQKNLETYGDFENNGTITLTPDGDDVPSYTDVENEGNGTFRNSDTITGTGSITVDNGFNDGDIKQSSFTINGTKALYGRQTADGQGIHFVNQGDIVVDNFVNKGNIDNDGYSYGSIATKNGSNSGIINQIKFTVENSTNESDKFTNNGTIAAEIENKGNFINEGTIGKQGGTNNNLTNSGTFVNSGNAYVNDLTNSGNFSNQDGMNLVLSGNLENTNEFNNYGELNVAGNISNTLTNAIFTNTGNIQVTKEFANDALLKNNGNILVNGTDGSMTNTGTILNEGNIDFSQLSGAGNNKLTNSGSITSDKGSIIGAIVENTGSITAKNGASLNFVSLDNDHEDGIINLENGSSLNISNQVNSLDGLISVEGNGTDPIINQNTIDINGGNFIGTLLVGNDEGDKTDLILSNINITNDAQVGIEQAGKISLSTGSIVNLNQGDEIHGDIELQQDGTLNLDGYTLTTGNKSTQEGGNQAYYSQYGGKLNLINNSTLKLGDSSAVMGGDLNIDSTSQFLVTSEENGTIDSGNFLDNLTIADGGRFGVINGDGADYNIGSINVDNGTANFTIDVLGRSNAQYEHGTDRFIGTDINGNGTLNIEDWTLAGDIFGWQAPIDRDIKLDNIFDYQNISPDAKISVTKKEVFTPIGWYQLNNRNGIAGNYSLNLTRLNPQVFRGQVATVAQWQNQLAIDDMLFNHSMVLPSFKDEDGGVAYSGIMANRYAAANPVFAPYQYSRKDGGLWYKMYGTFEHLQMNNGLSRVGNNAYGALIGADFGLKELRNGWKFMPTAYIGYNGAHQYFAGMGNYQNGGQAGFLGTWYKDNFIIGGLVYGGVYENSMDIASHVDNTFNYFAGAATKMAYNWRFHRDWVLQPNLMAAYNFFGQQNWHTNYGQMGMMAGMLNGVNIAPGLNLIWEKETFSIYGTLQYMYNINGAVGGQAGNVGLPQLEMQRGYIQYGLGFNKRFSDRFSGYLQAVLRNVGRTGVGFQMGFNILLGK